MDGNPFTAATDRNMKRRQQSVAQVGELSRTTYHERIQASSGHPAQRAVDHDHKALDIDLGAHTARFGGQGGKEQCVAAASHREATFLPDQPRSCSKPAEGLSQRIGFLCRGEQHGYAPARYRLGGNPVAFIIVVLDVFRAQPPERRGMQSGRELAAFTVKLACREQCCRTLVTDQIYEIAAVDVPDHLTPMPPTPHASDAKRRQ